MCAGARTPHLRITEQICSYSSSLTEDGAGGGYRIKFGCCGGRYHVSSGNLLDIAFAVVICVFRNGGW